MLLTDECLCFLQLVVPYLVEGLDVEVQRPLVLSFISRVERKS